MHNSWESIATSIPEKKFEFLDQTRIFFKFKFELKKHDQTSSDRKYGDTYCIIVEKALQHQHQRPNLIFLDQPWILVQISIWIKKHDQTSSDRKYGDTYCIIVEKALQHQHHRPNFIFYIKLEFFQISIWIKKTWPNKFG